MTAAEEKKEIVEYDTDVILGAGTALQASIARYLSAYGRKVHVVAPRAALEKQDWGQAELFEGTPIDPNVVELTCAEAETIYVCLEFQHRKWRELAHRFLNNVVCFAIERNRKVFLACPAYDNPTFANNFAQDTLAAQREGFIQVLVARLPQLYGAGIRNRLHDGVYDAIFSGKKKAFWSGSLDAPRDLLHVDDAGRACASLGLSPLAYGRSWDVSQGNPITGRQFMEYAFSLAGRTLEMGAWRKGLVRVGALLDEDSLEVAEGPYDYGRPMVLDGRDFISNFPGFQFTSLEAGLTEIFEWYRDFLKPHSRLQDLLPLSSLPA